MTNLETQEFEKDLGYGQLFSVFWQRRYCFLGVFTGVLSLGILIALAKKPTYESYTRFLVEPSYWDKQQDRQQTDLKLQSDYATQLNLMRSRKLIRQAVRELKSEYPDITLKEVRANYDIYQIIDEEKQQEVDTNIFEASYIDDNPVKTKKVLETIQKIYQQYNVEQQEKRLQEGLSFINKQLPVARQSFTEAQLALKKFRQENNLIAPEKEAGSVAEELRELEQERNNLQTKQQETKTLYSQLQKQLDRSPQNATISSRLSESSRYQTLLNELQKTELKLASERIKYTDVNPAMQNLIEERQNKINLLKQEVAKTLGKVPTQLGIQGAALQKEGQLGKSDVDLSTSLVKAQTDLLVLQERDRGLSQTIEKLRQELNNYPVLIDNYNSLQQDIEVKQDSLQELLKARQQLGIDINRGGFNWRVIEAPQIGENMGSGKIRTLLLTGVIASFLGGISVLLREALDRHVRSSEQIEGQLSLTLLGEVPGLPESRVQKLAAQLPWHSSSEHLPSTLELIQWQSFRESLDLVYMNIQLLNEAKKIKSLVITSAVASEGKSTLTLGLALSAARLRKRVLLIDTDLRRPSLHQRLNLDNDRGLANLLLRNQQKPNIQQVSLLNFNIDVLTSGAPQADPIALLSGNNLKELITRFEQDYDLILLDTPPVLGMADTIQTASCCGGSLLVARIDRVTKAQISEATNLLNKLNLIGIIANGDKDNMSKSTLDRRDYYYDPLPISDSRP